MKNEVPFSFYVQGARTDAPLSALGGALALESPWHWARGRGGPGSGGPGVPDPRRLRQRPPLPPSSRAVLGRLRRGPQGAARVPGHQGAPLPLRKPSAARAGPRVAWGGRGPGLQTAGSEPTGACRQVRGQAPR
jgi:hypothetical protein